LLDDHPSYEDDDKIPPWEENDGYYGLLSRLVRAAAPNLVWSIKVYDSNTLHKDQMVNHYSRNGCFTTKVGLCNSLRNLQWFHSGCADQFFPRCYKLSHEDDRVAFIGKSRFLI
jgi:tubulin monoglycylase TTLL3/8